MGRRHLSSSFNVFGTDQSPDQNHLSAEQSYIPMGRDVARENGSHFHPTENFSPAFSGPPYDPFSHSSPPGNLHFVPENVRPNYYYRPTIQESNSGSIDPATGTGNRPFKRKNPAISGAFGRESTSSRCFGVGTYSGSLGEYHQNIPMGPTGRSLSIDAGSSSRNVRSRSRLDFEPNTALTDFSRPSRQHHPRILPINHPGPPGVTNADIAIGDYGRNRTLDTNVLTHESNQHFLRVNAEDIGGCYQQDSISSRCHDPVQPYSRCPPAQAGIENRSNYYGRVVPSYGTGLGYSHHTGHEASSSGSGLHGSSSRHIRPSSAVGWRERYLNKRAMRRSIQRFQSVSGGVDTYRSFGSEEINRSSIFVGSRNMFDQHRDMRLEIDNLGYEELLALGERIGSVNTGVSESMIYKCLVEKVYRSLDQIHGERRCAICLEEYEDEEKIASVKNCGHNYHKECIKKWLMMKNVCPICKSAALKD